MDLQNKIAVITGASGGIGSVLSKKLTEAGVRLIPSIVDLTDHDALDKFVLEVKSQTDHLDLLLNVAGIGVYKSLEDITAAEWEHSFALNVEATLLLSKELLPLLQKSPDSVILNIGSGAGVTPIGNRSLYCATKFALRGLTLSLAEEFSGRSPRFVLLTLGSVLTNFAGVPVDEKLKRQKEGKAYFTPNEVADKIIEILKTPHPEPEYTFYPSAMPEPASVA